MFESLLPVLQGLINATKAMASFDAFRKAQRGEAREARGGGVGRHDED